METAYQKKYDKIILEARIEAIEKIIAPYVRAFNSEIFSVKITLDTFNKDGDCERISFFNHLPYEDIPIKIESVNPEIKDYLQNVIERYKVEQMKLKQELENLK